MNLLNDDNYAPIQGFAPKKGTTLSGVYIPTKTVAVMLGGDVNISIDGISLAYSEGAGIILAEGIEYTFDTSVNVHMMD